MTHSAYGAGYSGGITYDYGYYKSHHGFTIRNNQFTYGGIGKRILKYYEILFLNKVYYRVIKVVNTLLG